MMLQSLMVAGQRLAEALRAENAALGALDLPLAAGLGAAKQQATEAFAAACAAAAKTGARAEGAERRAAAELTDRLGTLSSENRRLLERAIGIQSRVIETIASAALPRQAPGGYGAAGRRPPPRMVPPLAITTRA